MTIRSWTASLTNVVRNRAAGGQTSNRTACTVIEKIVDEASAPTDQHGVSWNVCAWRQGLEGSALADSVEVVATGLALKNDRAWITRGRVFSFADHAGRPAELFVAAMAWGFGSAGYGWYRTLHAYGAHGGTRLPRLIGGLRAASGSPEQAWTVLMGGDGLRGLGPAFGTKLAYFTGYDRKARTGPLIADRWTAWSFWALGNRWDIRTSAELYGRYVETVSGWATQLDCRGDDIERALFVAGPEVRRAWRDMKNGG